MIIIVEGIDRVGKTTLCNKISEELNVPIYKHIGDFSYHRMDNDNETDKMLQIIEVCRLTDSSIIFDRFHLTDFVYGEIERNYNIDKATQNFKEIDDMLSKMEDVFLIEVLPTDIKRSSKEHGKDLSIYNDEFKQLYIHSKIKNKWQVTYNTMYEAIQFINAIRGKNHEHKE